MLLRQIVVCSQGNQRYYKRGNWPCQENEVIALGNERGGERKGEEKKGLFFAGGEKLNGTAFTLHLYE